MKKAIVSAIVISLLLSVGVNIDYVSYVILSADSAEMVSGTCGKTMNWTYSEGTINISGTGSMNSNTDSNPCPWNEFKDEIQNVVIGKGVESIGVGMFSECSNLISVSFPDSLKTIGNYSFSSCNKLSSIVIPESVTSIGSGSFAMCINLSEVSIPSSVTYIGDLAFSNTKWLNDQRSEEEPFVIANGILINASFCAGDTIIPDSVTQIAGNAFYGCSDITSLTIPDSVKDIGTNAFNGCRGIKTVVIPASVENIGLQAFIGCTSLSEVIILSPECTIYDRATTFLNDKENYTGVIKGYKGSTAESYAKKYGYSFISLGNVPSLGDPNGDGVVDAKDASLILSEYSLLSTGEKATFTSAQKQAADVNTDGLTDSKDSSRILGYYSYLSTGGKETINDFLSK